MNHRSSCFFREILVRYDMYDNLVLENVALFVLRFVVRVCFRVEIRDISQVEVPHRH